MLRFFIILLLGAGIATAQMSERLTLRLFGGSTLPQESFVGQNLEFAQFGDFLQAGETTSNFEDYWNSGLNLGFGLDYQIFDNISAGLEFGANFFNINQDKFESGIKDLFADLGLPYNSDAGEITRGSTEIYTLLVSVKASYPLQMVTPYLRLSGGYMFVNQEALKVTYFDQPFGPNEQVIFFYDELPARDGSIMTGSVGGGFELRILPNVSSFVEINYTLGLNTAYDNVNASTILYPIRAGFVFNFSE